MRQNPNPKKAFSLLAAIPAVHQWNRGALAPIFRSRFCREAVQQMPQSHLGYPLIEHIIFKLRTFIVGAVPPVLILPIAKKCLTLWSIIY